VDAADWAESAPGYGQGRWYIVIGSAEYQPDDLEDCDQPLYQFAVSEGYAPNG
jgi:hypothetical protein